MNPDTIKTAALLLGAFGGLTGLAALINSLSKARSSSVENLKDVVKILNNEILRLQERVCNLEDKSTAQAKKIRLLESKVEHWRDKYYELCDWVRETFGREPFEDHDEPGK